MVNIKDVIHLDDYGDAFLSCGHTSKLYRRSIVENVPTADQVFNSKIVTRSIIEYPEFANSREIRIEPKIKNDKIPVTVSGDNNIKSEGLLDPNLILRREGGNNFIINSPIIYAETVNFGSTNNATTFTETKSISNQTISQSVSSIDINSIIEQVSSTPHSTDEKEKIKAILKELNNDLASKPLPVILDNVKKKFKDYLPLALPFVHQIVGLYFQGKL